MPVPLPLLINVMPVGSDAPVRTMEGTGKPVDVTVNVHATPIAQVVLFALVIAGGCCTVNVKVCVSFCGLLARILKL